MYFSDVVYLAFLLILLFIILYKGFKHQADNLINNIYRTPMTSSTIRPRRHCTEVADRQGNIFTIPDESTNNSLQHRCPDFFYVEPSAEDAARIRAQLEKDEKDLPTYEEVMAMSLAQAQAGSMAPHNESNTSIAATTHIPVPPYSEINTNVSHPASQLPSVVTNSTIPPPHSGGATVWPMLTSPVGSSGDASTSRAAAAAATTTSTTVTIANSMSNTSV